MAYSLAPASPLPASATLAGVCTVPPATEAGPVSSPTESGLGHVTSLDPQNEAEGRWASLSLCVSASCLVPSDKHGPGLAYSLKRDEKHVQQRLPSYGAATKLSSELNPSRLLDPIMSLD